MYWASPFCTQGTHMPSSGSFVTMYLAELHFGNGYMEIGLLISNLHGRKIGILESIESRHKETKLM